MTGTSGGMSWEDLFAVVATPTSVPSPSESEEEHARLFGVNDVDITDFGPASLSDDGIQLITCKDCNKVVLLQAAKYHKENCKLAVDIADGRLSPSVLDDGLDGPSHGIHTSGADDGAGSTALTDIEARRLARMEAKEEKRRAKEMAKKGKGKWNKGPPNVDRQCGVINDKGLPCTRSLTCKTHSMGAKRAVPGRSQSYDVLLFEWQKATNPTFVAKLEEKEREKEAAAQRAAENAARAEARGEGKKRKRKNSIIGAGAGGSAGGTGLSGQSAPTSDEADMYAIGADTGEVDAELTSLVNSLRPLAYPPSAPFRLENRILPMAINSRSLVLPFSARAKRLRSCWALAKEGIISRARAHAPDTSGTQAPAVGGIASLPPPQFAPQAPMASNGGHLKSTVVPAGLSNAARG